MTPLEKYAYNEALKHLFAANDSLRDEEKHRLEHTYIFIRSNIRKAIDALRAIEGHPTTTNQ